MWSTEGRPKEEDNTERGLGFLIPNLFLTSSGEIRSRFCSFSGGMGRERKSMEEKPIRDEEKGKKRRADEGDESSRSDRKEKRRKDRKSHSHKDPSHKAKKSRDKTQHQKKDWRTKHGFQELSGDDYFLKNNEFATWLKEERNIFFSSLSSELARELFSEFVKEWNKLKLESRYYEGITAGPRTAHDWKIKK